MKQKLIKYREQTNFLSVNKYGFRGGGLNNKTALLEFVGMVSNELNKVKLVRYLFFGY